MRGIQPWALETGGSLVGYHEPSMYIDEANNWGNGEQHTAIVTPSPCLREPLQSHKLLRLPVDPKASRLPCGLVPPPKQTVLD